MKLTKFYIVALATTLGAATLILDNKQAEQLPLGTPYVVRVFANVPALCEGECTNILTDVIVDMEGGFGPYRVTTEINWNPAIPNNMTTYTKIGSNSIHAFRICHDNTFPAIGTQSLADDITVFNVPTVYFPGELVIKSVEDSNGCLGTVMQDVPIPITARQGTYLDYLTEIPTVVCDSLILPDIIPFQPNASYYSEPKGQGLQFSAGTVLDAAAINLPSGDLLDSLYIFDPTDICESERLYPFMIQPSPKHKLPNDTLLCGDYSLPAFSGPVTTPNAQYATSINFETSSLLSEGDIINTSQTIYLADTVDYILGECVFLDSFKLDITTAPNAGLDTTLFICEGRTTIIADPFLLLRGADPGGTWNGTQIPDLDFNNPEDIDLSHMIEGQQYTLNYVVEPTGCPFDEATIIFQGIAAPYAGDSTSIIICRADGLQDLYGLINNPDFGGSWTQTGGPSIFIPADGMMDFTTALAFEYVFLYTIAATTSCPAQYAELKITLTESVDAGADNSATVCKGDSLILFELLDLNIDASGTFKVDGVLPVQNGIWDSNMFLLDEGIINVQYILDGVSGSCVSDTSDFVITLIKEPYAGVPTGQINPFCLGDTILLSDILQGETTGGLFYEFPNLSQAVPEEHIVVLGGKDIYYIVNGGGSCNADTSSFSVFPTTPFKTELVLSESQLCTGQSACVTMTLQNQGEAEILFLVKDSINADSFNFIRPFLGNTNYVLCSTETFGSFSRDSIFLGRSEGKYSIEVIEIDRGNCTDFEANVLTLDVYESYYEEKFGTVCRGQTTNIDGVGYGASTELIFQTTYGCDSIINIIIDTFPTSVGSITRNFCAGTTQEILGQTFSTDIDELITFPGQSVHGCDSTAQVLLDFSDKAIGTLDTAICDGEVINIDGITLMDNGTTEIDYPLLSSTGCDSSTLVTVTIQDASQGRLDTSICIGSTINIDGAIIMNSGLIDISFAGGNSQGCDSSTLVNVVEIDATQGRLDTTICEGEIILIDGTPLMEEGLTDVPYLAGSNNEGCDSSTLVTVTVINDLVGIKRLTNCNLDTLVIDGIIIIDAPITEVPYIPGSENGCDTITLVFIDIPTVTTEQLTVDLCEGESLIIHGETYEFDAIPEEIYLKDSGGCDSLIIGVDYTITQASIDDLVINSTELGINNYQLSYSSSEDITDPLWSGSALLSCSECPSTELSITADTEITLTVSNKDGCEYKQTVLLTYYDNTIHIYEPTAISLSEPGNDIFFLQSNSDFIITQLRIYDRWGNIVFENQDFLSNDSAQGWDGRYMAKQVEQGVYVYQLAYEDPDQGLISKLGNLTVFR